MWLLCISGCAVDSQLHTRKGVPQISAGNPELMSRRRTSWPSWPSAAMLEWLQHTGRIVHLIVGAFLKDHFKAACSTCSLSFVLLPILNAAPTSPIIQVTTSLQHLPTHTHSLQPGLPPSLIKHIVVLQVLSPTSTNSFFRGCFNSSVLPRIILLLYLCSHLTPSFLLSLFPDPILRAPRVSRAHLPLLHHYPSPHLLLLRLWL